MTNIEFIDKEIEFENKFPLKDEEKINHLQSIKNELEAWEVVKKYVKEISINGIIFEHIINVSHTEQNYEIVKKALEVNKNEKL